MGTKSVTLELKAPRGEKPTRIYAASWNSSGAPPTDAAFAIDYSVDAGKTWKPVVADWKIQRRAPEPGDFWSQSFTYGDVALTDATGPVRVRFSNSGGKSFRKVEGAPGVPGGRAGRDDGDVRVEGRDGSDADGVARLCPGGRERG